MARIQIKDLPKDLKVGKKEMRQIVGGAYDINSLVQAVLGEAYHATNSTLDSHAGKVAYFNSKKESIRDQTQSIRGHTQPATDTTVESSTVATTAETLDTLHST